MHHRRLLMLLAHLILTLLPTLGWAATYYVATNGGGSTCSQNNPCSSINTGISRLASGDTLFLRGGSYRETIDPATGALPSGGGSWETATTIAGYPGETVTMYRTGNNVINIAWDGGFGWLIFRNLILDAENTTVGNLAGALYIGKGNHHIRFDGVEFMRGNNTVGAGHASYVEFLNCKNHGAIYYAWYYSGDHTIIDNCEIYDNAGFGLHFFSAPECDGCPSPSYISDNIFRNNRLYNNGYHGEASIIISHGSNNLIYNNLIMDNGGGIQVDYDCDNCKVWNNTIVNNNGSGIDVGRATNTSIINNIIAFNAGNPINNNGTGTQQSNNLFSNPQFANAGSTPRTKFALMPDSPARNKGMTLAAVTHDMVGTRRPQESGYDIGALEYVGGGDPTAPPAPTPRAVVTNLRVRTTP